MAPSPRPLARLALLVLALLVAASTGCSLVSSTDCTERPGICPDGSVCASGECVASADADADPDVDAPP